MSSTPNTSWLRGAHPWIWAAIVAAACVSSVFLLGEKPVYEAHAAFEVPSSSEEFDGDALILQAARKAGLQTDEEFNQTAGNAALVTNVRGHLKLKNDGQLVQVTFKATNAPRAAAFANALVDAFNDEMESRGLAKAVEMTAGLEALQELIDAKELKLSNPALKLSGAEKLTLIRETNRQRNLYDAMLLHASAPRTSARFTDHAPVPTEPINASPWTWLRFGVPMVLIGVLLFAISRFRLQQLDVPAAQFDVMCRQVEIEKPVVAVSNAGTGFINPDTLLDYVENLLESGNTVLIIDCELGGELTRSVGLRGEPGFTDFLMASPTLRGRVPAWRTNRVGVSVMPVGTRPNRMPVLLASAGLRERMAELLAIYDRVVINAPPVLTTGEMRDLSPLVDGVILVAGAERSVGLAQLAVQQIEDFGGRVIGLVEDRGQLAVM